MLDVFKIILLIKSFVLVYLGLYFYDYFENNPHLMLIFLSLQLILVLTRIGIELYQRHQNVEKRSSNDGERKHTSLNKRFTEATEAEKYQSKNPEARSSSILKEPPDE